MELRLAEGLTLVALRGYAAPEVMECFSPIRALCRRTGERTQWFMMLWQHNMLAGLRALQMEGTPQNLAAAYGCEPQVIALAWSS